MQDLAEEQPGPLVLRILEERLRLVLLDDLSGLYQTKLPDEQFILPPK
jgi:hypothetical protein